MKGTILIFASSPLKNGGCSYEICLWEEENNRIWLLGFETFVLKGDTVIGASCGYGYVTLAMVNMLADELARTVFMQCRECTKHRKSLANTAITKDLVQPKRMYGGLDALLDVCKWCPAIPMEFLVLLPPLFSSFTVSDDDNACEPQLCSFYDCTLYVNLLGDECGPGLQTYVLVGLFGFSPCPVTYAIWYLHIKCFEDLLTLTKSGFNEQVVCSMRSVTVMAMGSIVVCGCATLGG
uniref:Uncharacterized protein n=1 Tax=Quercus lobata TaxID=97700 RepID=A0A7N2R3W7_QUELO